MRSSVLFTCSLALLLAGAAAASCAKGGDTTGFHQVGGSSPTTNEQGGSNAGGSPTTHPRTITTTESGSGGATGTTTTDTSSGGNGSGAGPDCAAPTTCTGATQVANINGDDSSNAVVEHGTTAAWYTLTVVEDSDLPNDLSYVITLDNAGTDFNLFVYEGDENGVSCTSSAMQGFGTPQTYHHCWGDSFGSTDDRHIIVEVRHVSATCPGTQWTLSIRGDPDGGSCP